MKGEKNSKILKLILIIVLICWLWFAFIPEYFNFSLPTGGWDWLVFTGTIASVYIAYIGIKEQIEASNKNTINQIESSNNNTLDQISESNKLTQLQLEKNFELMQTQMKLTAQPFLVTRLILSKNDIEEITPTNIRYVILAEKNKLLNIFPIYLFKRDDYETKCILSIKNKGSGPAFNISMCIKKRCGYDSSGNVVYKNYIHYFDKVETTRNNPIHVLDRVSLAVDSDNEYIAFDVSKIENEFDNVLEFTYYDLYDNCYIQTMEIDFGKIGNPHTSMSPPKQIN